MIISITNLKGGVGKSTLSQNLAVAFAEEGKKVCLADTDSEQQTSVKWSSMRGEDLKTIPVYLINPEKITEEILTLKKNYDVVLIDGTPALTELTTRIVILSDFVFVPVLPSIADVWALDTFLKRFKEAKMTKESLGATVKIAMILNRFSEKTNLDKEVQDALLNFDLLLFDSKISNLVAYREATAQGLGVMEMKEKKAKIELKSLFQEIKKFIQ
jgi:chromosome partitioning protein